MQDSFRSLLNSFPRKYIINLRERTDRRSEVYREFARLGTDIDELGFEFFSAFRFQDAQGFPSAGARGCFASHLACLKLAIEHGCDRVLILEDDVHLSPALAGSADRLQDRLDRNDWAFSYFAHERTSVRRAVPEDVSDMQPWDGFVLAAAMYAVQGREVLTALVDFLERIADPAKAVGGLGPMTIDGAFNEFRNIHPDLPTLVSNPLLVWQRPSASDISPSFADRIGSRLPILQPVLSLLRSAQQSIRRIP